MSKVEELVQQVASLPERDLEKFRACLQNLMNGSGIFNLKPTQKTGNFSGWRKLPGALMMQVKTLRFDPPCHKGILD